MKYLLFFLSYSVVLFAQQDSVTTLHDPQNSSAYKIKAQQIQTDFTPTFSDILNRYSGFNLEGDHAILRGASSENIGYYVEGFYMNSLKNNHFETFIIPQAIGQLNIEAGNYNARYSYGNAGIINTRFKKGRGAPSINVDYKTDSFLQGTRKQLNTFGYNDKILTVTANGAINTLGHFNYFIAYQKKDFMDNVKRFSKGFTFSNIEFTDPNRESRFNADWKVRDDFTNGNSLNSDVVNAHFGFEDNNVKATLIAIWANKKQYADNNPYFNVFNPRSQYTLTDHISLLKKVQYRLNSHIAMELNGSFQQNKAQLKDDYYGSKWHMWLNWDALKEKDENISLNNGENLKPYQHNKYLFSAQHAIKNPNYFKDENRKWGIGFKLMAHLNRYFKIEAQIKRNVHRYKHYSINANATRYRADSKIGRYYSLAQVSNMRNYGYGQWGGDKNPIRKAKIPHMTNLFLTTSTQIKGFNSTVVYQYSYYNSDVIRLEHQNSGWGALTRGKYEGWLGKAKTYRNHLFRLFNSYQVSPSLKVALNAGSYISLPSTGKNIEFIYHYCIAGPSLFTSIPKPALAHKIDFNLIYFPQLFPGKLNLTFFRDINSGIYVEGYRNKASEKKRGMEAQFTSYRKKGFKFSVGYTYIDAQNEYEQNLRNKYYQQFITPDGYSHLYFPSSYVRPHTMVLNMDWRGMENKISLLNGWGAVLNYTLKSGKVYTHTKPRFLRKYDRYGGSRYLKDLIFGERLQAFNEESTPWYHRLNLSIDKTITINHNNTLKFYCTVYNLFNRKNILNLYAYTQSTKTDGYLEDENNLKGESAQFTEQFVNIYKAVNGENGAALWELTDRQLYDHPRQIHMGVAFGF